MVAFSVAAVERQMPANPLPQILEPDKEIEAGTGDTEGFNGIDRHIYSGV